MSDYKVNDTDEVAGTVQDRSETSGSVSDTVSVSGTALDKTSVSASVADRVSITGSVDKAPFSPADISDLAIWLDDSDPTSLEKDDGSGGYEQATTLDTISRWKDRSGNGNHQLQATSTDQPTLTSRGVEFDGNDDHMIGTLSGLSGDQEVTVFHVATPDDYGEQSIERQIWCLGVPYPTDADGFPSRDVCLFCYEGSTSNYGELVMGVRLYGGNAIWPDAGTSQHLITTRYAGGGATWEAWKNDGSKLGHVASSMPGGMDFRDPNFSIGKGALHGGLEGSRDELFFLGPINEIIVYLRALTDDERQDVVTYLMSKRGL